MEVKSYSAFVKKAMPESKVASAKRCIVGHYLLRPVVHVVSIPLVRMDVSALLITKLSALVVALALFAFLIAQTLEGFIIAWLLLLVWNVLDGVDGDIARYTDTASPLGALWDSTVGWFAAVVFYIGMGAAAFRLPGVINCEPLRDYYLFLGCICSLSWTFPRLVMHKKLGLFNRESVAAVQDREHFGPIKLIFFNVTSINGFGALIFLASMCLGLNDICLFVYTGLSLAMACASCYTLLR